MLLRGLRPGQRLFRARAPPSGRRSSDLHYHGPDVLQAWLLFWLAILAQVGAGDERQVAKTLIDINTITEDKSIRHVETDVVASDGHLAAFFFIEQHADLQ